MAIALRVGTQPGTFNQCAFYSTGTSIISIISIPLGFENNTSFDKQLCIVYFISFGTGLVLVLALDCFLRRERVSQGSERAWPACIQTSVVRAQNSARRIRLWQHRRHHSEWMGWALAIAGTVARHPYPFGAKLGAPLREDIVHLASDSAKANSPRWKIEGKFKISDAGLGQEPLGKVEKRVTCSI